MSALRANPMSRGLNFRCRVGHLLRLERRDLLAYTSFAPMPLVENAGRPQTAHVATADIDGDGAVDVIAGVGALDFANQLFWRDNSGARHAIDMTSTAIQAVQVADIDGDLDLDLVVETSEVVYNPDGDYYRSELIWYENLDSRGTFSSKLRIDEYFFAANDMAAADFDGDGTTDIATAGVGNLMLFVNPSGNGTFSPRSMIGQPGTAVELLAGDVEHDDDIDLFVVGNSSVSWFRNAGGEFLPEIVIADEGRTGATAALADLDGDSNLDLIFASTERVSWWRLQDGIAEEALSFSEPFPLSRRLSTADFDQDGDLDILTSDGYFGVRWFENMNGAGVFSSTEFHRVANTFQRLSSLQAVNMDKDKDWDIIYTDRNLGIGWFENRVAGDINGDGVFDSSDLVAAFAAGQYEDGIRRNSTFFSGDWNGDGEFTTQDLVFVFQAGV